jgi:hypothetical protein
LYAREPKPRVSARFSRVLAARAGREGAATVEVRVCEREAGSHPVVVELPVVCELLFERVRRIYS